MFSRLLGLRDNSRHTKHSKLRGLVCILSCLRFAGDERMNVCITRLTWARFEKRVSIRTVWIVVWDRVHSTYPLVLFGCESIESVFFVYPDRPRHGWSHA